MWNFLPWKGKMKTARNAPPINRAKPPTYAKLSIVAAPIVSVSGISESRRVKLYSQCRANTPEFLSGGSDVGAAAAQRFFFGVIYLKYLDQASQLQYFPRRPAQSVQRERALQVPRKL